MKERKVRLGKKSHTYFKRGMFLVNCKRLRFVENEKNKFLRSLELNFDIFGFEES